MLKFTQLLKAFASNYRATVDALFVTAIVALSGYVLALHKQIGEAAETRALEQADCAERLLNCERSWRLRNDSIQREELKKTQQQVDALTAVLKRLRKR